MAASYREMTQSRSRKQSAGVGDIRWDIEQHTIAIGDATIVLTSLQYHLLSLLRHGLPTTYSELTRGVYNCDVDERTRMMMDKLVDRIRGKLQGTGIYVYCIFGYGYLLLNEV